MMSDDNNRLVQSAVDQAIARKKEAEQQLTLKKEELEKLGNLANKVFSSKDGEEFARYWVREMGLFKHDPQFNQVKEVENRGAKRFYLTYIRPQLKKDIREKIENE